MNEKTIRNKLWEKVNKEFENFKKEQLCNDKETIFENAYKIALMRDFTDMCDPYCSPLSLNYVKALLKEKYPAHTLYNFYMDTDEGTIGDLFESIWFRLNDLVENNIQSQNKKIRKEMER